MHLIAAAVCVLGVFCVQDGGTEGVKIDGQLASITSDCYERIAIGQRLKTSDVLRTVVTQQAKECEKECDLDLDKCSSYDFGIGHQGNGTCNLSPKVPPRSGTLVEDPDYDVYVKRQECRYVELPPPSYPSPTDHNHNHHHSMGEEDNHGRDSCFRRLLTGKRVAERHVRRSLPSRSADLCQEECASEKHFTCEGFNYRVDIGGFGRGSCELTDVPSTRMDLGRDFYPDRDYDFYERDRNSGPDCNVLPGRGPGGGLYGGSEPWRPWTQTGGNYYGSGGDRERWKGSSSSSHGPWGGGYEGGSGSSYGGGGGSGYGGGWGSYGQGGSGGNYGGGWSNYGGGGGGSYGGGNGNYGGWGSYGQGGGSGSYGGGWGGGGGSSVGHYGGSGGPWGGGGSGGVGHYGGGGGSWGSGGGGGGGHRYWYGNAGGGGGGGGWQSSPGDRNAPHPECFPRARTGFRLDRRIVKVALSAPSLHECEEECARHGHFVCNTFSFRYSFAHENCHLSERMYRDLDPYHDLVPDRDFDMYTRNEYERSCLLEDLPPRHPQEESECFVRVRSGQRLVHSVVKDSLNAHSVGECELECLRSRYFTCRIFSYRYGPPVIGQPLDNCHLSDWPFHELEPRLQLIDDLGYELYERGSFGHGCEINHYVPYPEEQEHVDPHQHQHGRPPLGPPPAYPKPSDELCYVGYGGPARLLPIVVRSSLDVPTELDCKAECTRMRDNFNFFCTALSFRAVNAPPHHHHDENMPEHNCLLSDIEQRDLRPGLDYVHEKNNWMFAWNFMDPHCDQIAHNPEQQDRNHGHYTPGRVDLETWQRFTVSGRPCRYGTVCTENREAGFWSCELEGGDAGAWDYCCRPGHQCGYSEGFNYPWCYVGSAARDQWRPCSDHYYPYSHDPHGGPHGPIQHIEAFHYESYGPPRYWPVAYLHKSAPPNATTIPFSGDKDPSLLSNYDPHFDGGYDNFVENHNRVNYGKKLSLFTPSNYSTSVTATVTKITIDKSTSQDTKDKPDGLFQVVDDDDSSGQSTKNHKQTETNETTTVSPTGAVKLQPRFVTLKDQDRRLSKLIVARNAGTGDGKQWRWRGEEEENTRKVSTAPVEFRRKTGSGGSNSTAKMVQFEMAAPRATVTKL